MSTTDAATAPPVLRTLLPLLVAGTLGRLPSVTLPIASLLLVADRTSLTRGGLASGAVSLGAGTIGLVVGRRLDGSRARQVLVVLSVLHVPAVAAFIAVAGSRNDALLVMVSLVAGATVAPVGPVVRALLAQRTDPTSARQVFAYDSMSVEVTWIGGPLLVSAMVLLSGPAVAVALSPLLGAVGVVAVARQPARRVIDVDGTGRWVVRSVVQLVLAFALAGTAFRAVTIAITEVARLQGNEAASGVLIAVWAMGSLLGGFLLSRYRFPPPHVLGIFLAVSIGLVGLGASSIWLTGALAFVSGIPTAPFVSGLNVLVATAVAEMAHARAFAAMQAAATVMSAVGAAAGGAVIDRFGPAAVSIPSAALLFGAAALSRLAPSGVGVAASSVTEAVVHA